MSNGGLQEIPVLVRGHSSLHHSDEVLLYVSSLVAILKATKHMTNGRKEWHLYLMSRFSNASNSSIIVKSPPTDDKHA